jgi:hypothetical protein
MKLLEENGKMYGCYPKVEAITAGELNVQGALYPALCINWAEEF